MTTLTHLMRKHEILHRDLALIAGVTERAVYHWVRGTRKPPRSALLLLQALDEGRIDAEWLIRKLKQP